ncbi:unnamed protein product, partial [Medioppia subpectinata]
TFDGIYNTYCLSNDRGLQYVSKHRQQRIKLIAEHLVDHKYDIVFLQEIWVQSDFDYIRKATESEFKFSHFFKNGSVLGNSGLAVLVKWVPKAFHFHPFSVNGSPFRLNHGDWYTSKGVGYIRVELDSLNLHLFCTHMHAQYHLEERLNDITKFNKESIEGGDCIPKHNQLVRDHSDSETDDEYHTCGHRDNKFTDDCSGKRIDFLLYRFSDYAINSSYNEVIAETNAVSLEDDLCGVEYMNVHCKDTTGLSFSDHQPVVAQFKIKSSDMKSGSRSAESGADNPMANNLSTLSDNYLIGGNKEANISSNGCGSTHHRKVHEKRFSGETGEGIDCNESVDTEYNKTDKMGLLSGKPKLKSNVLLELAESASKFSKSGRPLQLKHMASNALKSRQQSNSSKRQSLENVKCLLEDYVTQNQLSFKYFVFTSLFLFIIICLLASTLWTFLQIAVIEVVFLTILLSITPMFVNFIKFLNTRQEINAIKAIIDDMDKQIYLYQ